MQGSAVDGKKVYRSCSGVQQYCKTRSIVNFTEFSVKRLCLDKQNEKSEKSDLLIVIEV